MGLDFIREKSGRPWRKRWAGGLEQFKMPGLFDLPIDRRSRTLTVELQNGASVGLGEELIAHTHGQQLDVCRGVATIGCVRNPPRDVMDAITTAGTVAEARIVQVGIFGNTAEMQLHE